MHPLICCTCVTVSQLLAKQHQHDPLCAADGQPLISLRSSITAWAEGASGGSTQPLWLGDTELFPEAGERCTLWLFSGHRTVLEGTRCANLLMHWATSPGDFQEGGSRLTVLIPGEAGKPETPEQPDPSSPAGSRELRDPHLAPATYHRQGHGRAQQPSAGHISVLPCLLAALLVIRGTRMQPFLRSQADISV